ncbi:DUF1523 family protein [Pseudomonas sp. P66]|uniref:DUF1523 family protein n=1 Tax=Pseudomonas arcuscaelestis TaxID=2710591 RepID=A0ABS2BZI3_9PSED|nr:DUF1523 family protein [Pseudomonas arcuscaelestis]MBM5459030.1 DUF1523 family protein [Pseudomonas arcuscaelestis]
MPWVKRSIGILSLALIAVAAVCFHHYLPRHDVVHVTGVEVKRMDADGVISAENPADGPTRDVYFINTVSTDSKREVVVYRNEDTGWGFPWYFKFDSADLQAKAQDYSRDPNQLVLIRYYGWRFQIFSMFPNITEIKATTSRAEPFPLFNTIFFSVLFVLLVVIGLLVRRAIRRRSAPMVPVISPSK